MSNDWFQFREFIIHQGNSAMKVGTDGVLLGAWVDCENCGSVLDIGTGTGLLSLMVAQRNRIARVTALEIDEAAGKQADENVKLSPWPDRIAIIRADFISWDRGTEQKFDLILCNPPYFSRALKNPDLLRAQARHDDDLPLEELIKKASHHLGPDGKLALILPVGRADEALVMADRCRLHLIRKLEVRGRENTNVIRVLMEWGMQSKPMSTAGLIIETNKRGVYTDEYRLLTGGFYL